MVLLGKRLFRVVVRVIGGAFRVFAAGLLWLFFAFLEVVKGVFLCLGCDWAFFPTVRLLFYVYTQGIRGFLSEFLNF
jgi:hypothetical protein